MSGKASVVDTDTYGDAALLLAAEFGELDIIQWLLQHDRANIGARDSGGTTSLVMAAENGHLIVVQWLIQHGGADVGEKNNNGDTALLFSALYGYQTMVQWLIQEGGADIGDRNNEGDTALLVAAGDGPLLVVQWLLRFGKATITDVNMEGSSFWDIIQYRFRNASNVHTGTLLKVMLAHGVPPSSFIKTINRGILVKGHPVFLCEAFGPLLAHGEVIRQRLPADSPWRNQRATTFQASDCGIRLPTDILSVLADYTVVSEEDLWEMLEHEHPQSPTITTGVKRKRAGKDNLHRY
jgi:hypothetical protein